MSLYSISGIGCEDCGGGCGYIGGRKKRAARKAKRKARKTGVNCKGARVKKIALAPARNAFLALVRLNVKKLALKLAANYKDPAKKLKLHQKWCKLGGDAKKLESAVMKAYAKYKRKRGIIGYMDATDGQIGSVATLLAASVPILKALAPFLKTVLPGSKGAEAAETASEAAEELAPQETAQAPEQAPEESAEVGAIGINPWLIGAGALAAFYLLKKKK